MQLSLRTTQRDVAPAVFAMLWVLACGARVGATPIPSPDFLKLPALRLRVVSQHTGNLIQTSRLWTESVESNGETLVAVHETANLPSGSTLESRTLLRPGASVRPLQVERRIRAADGVTLALDMRQFRPDAFPYSGMTVPDDTYPLNQILLYLIGYLPLDAAGVGSFYVLGEVQAYKLDVWKHGTEEIDVPAGHFACDHLRLRPNPESFNIPAILRPLVPLFLPDIDAWVTREPPHLTVRIRGPLGPPNDRDVVLELLAREDATQ